MGLTEIFGEDNAILLHEIEYGLYFILPLSVFMSILIAPQGFFRKPWRAVLYVLLGPIGTADLARRAVRARATSAAAGETRPATIRFGGRALLVAFALLLGTGLVLAMETTWPEWYFPLVRAHRWIGLVFVVGYLGYLLAHVQRYAGAKNLAIHFAFTTSVVLVLLFVNVDSRLPAPVLWAAVFVIFASAVWLRRVDRRTEEGKTRGGLLLNTYMLISLASGFYLVPSVNVAIANNFGNYYYHLHGLASMFGVPLAVFLFLHHVRRTPTSFPWPARIAVLAVGVPFAAYALTVADRKTHATDLGGYHHQRVVAAPTLPDHADYPPPHEWWVDEMNEVESCARCHDVLHAQWQGSAHALSGLNVFYRAVLDEMLEHGRLDDTAMCQSCHQPVLAAVRDRAWATSEAAMAADEGVSCKSCHLAFELADPPRNGAVVYREEERAQGWLTPGEPYRVPPDSYIRDDLRLHLKSFSNSALFGSREFCATCHRIEIPAHAELPEALVLPNPYDLNPSGDPAGGDGCKQCHMPEDAKNSKGVKFPNHHMFGVNGTWEHMLPADASPELREAVRHGDAATLTWLAGGGRPQAEIGYGRAFDRPAFGIDADWSAAGASASLRVELLNARGGHPFPLGALDLAEAWLRVEVTGATGTLLASGLYDEHGQLTEGTRRYGARFVGPGGGPLVDHDILAMTAVEDVRLLEPAIPRVEEFALEVPPEAYPVRVTAQLSYRRAHPGFAAGVLAGERERMPRIVLAERVCTVAAPGADCEG